MQLPLKEPIFAKYLYVSPDNVVHVFMPVVSGTDIGLDNTCKAVYALQEFFGKGSNSNVKATIKGELLAYKEALENDLELLRTDAAALAQQKFERLVQINAYLAVVTQLENHQELNCLNQGFPSYPRPLYDLMQDRTTSNLYSMVLRPTAEDGYLRTEAANPIFSVAHRSVARNIGDVVSPLQQALIEAYRPLRYETKDLKSQVIHQVLAQLQSPKIPVNFKELSQILQVTVGALMAISVDFTKNQQGEAITQQAIDKSMGFNPQTATPTEYIEALLGYCASNLFDTDIESPFNALTQAESWSIATQFLLGITNIYGVIQGKITADTNFGQILDSNSDLSKSLAQRLAEAQKRNRSIEEACLSWMNEHTRELKLTAFTPEEFKAIQETFARQYVEIKDSPHFDEFLVLKREQPGNFVIHLGSICTSFANFVSSPLFGLPETLTKPLERARAHANTLSTEIPHHNPLVQGEVEVDTRGMDQAALQALYERIQTYKDQKLKEKLLAQLKQERPDFKPQIDAKQFLQHVAYGEQNEAESLLKKDAEQAQALLTASNIPFTDYSGRTFTCTAYEYAYWAKDTHMCRMLEKYMDAHTKQELLARVQRIEELTGPELMKKPRGLSYTQKGIAHQSAHFDLTPLKQALKTYIDAYNQSPKATETDWDALDKIWIKVGLPQRDVPAHIAHEYCHPTRSFEDVSKNHSLLDAANPANLERGLRFYNYKTCSFDSWFTRGAYSTGAGLGVSFTIMRGGSGVGGGGGGCGAAGWSAMFVDLAAIEAIDKVRTEDLKQSLANLVVPSTLPVHQTHSR